MLDNYKKSLLLSFFLLAHVSIDARAADAFGNLTQAHQTQDNPLVTTSDHETISMLFVIPKGIHKWETHHIDPMFFENSRSQSWLLLYMQYYIKNYMPESLWDSKASTSLANSLARKLGRIFPKLKISKNTMKSVRLDFHNTDDRHGIVATIEDRDGKYSTIFIPLENGNLGKATVE